MELAYLLDPRILGIAGVSALLITDLIVWYFYPEKHKRVWRGIKNFFHKFHHFLLTIYVVVSWSALGLVALYFYKPEAVAAIQTASPQLYNIASQYVLTLLVAIFVLNAVGSALYLMGHYGNQLDNGIIDDPDQKKWDDQKTLEDLDRDYRIEQMRKEYRKEMEQIREDQNKDKKDLDTKLEAMRMWFFEHGDRAKEGTSLDGIEHREFPYYLPEEDGLKLVEPKKQKVEPASLKTEATVPEPIVFETVELKPEKMEPILPVELQKVEEPAAKKAEPKKLSWKHASDWDEILLGKWGNH